MDIKLIERVTVIGVLFGIGALAICTGKGMPVPHPEDDMVDMSTLCIVDAPAHVSGEVLTAEQLTILYASDGVRDKNGELVLSPLLERDKRGNITPAPGVQGPWRQGDLTATMPWYAPWVMPQQSDKGGGCQKATGSNRVPEPGTLALMLAGILTFMTTTKWRIK